MTNSGPQHTSMGKPDSTQMLVAVRRLCGHHSAGPSAVADQSLARIRVAISPATAPTSSFRSSDTRTEGDRSGGYRNSGVLGSSRNERYTLRLLRSERDGRIHLDRAPRWQPARGGADAEEERRDSEIDPWLGRCHLAELGSDDTVERNREPQACHDASRRQAQTVAHDELDQRTRRGADGGANRELPRPPRHRVRDHPVRPEG